jgi:hypothetical protein
MKKQIEFKEKTVYHAETLEQAEWLLKKAHEQGFKWIFRGSFISDNRWVTYKNDTCYDIINGRYGTVSDYGDKVYQIIKVSDLMKDFEPNTEKKLIEFIEHIGQINEKIEERLQGIEAKLKVELPKQPETPKQSWEDITTLEQVVDIYEEKYAYEYFLSDTRQDLLTRGTRIQIENSKAAAYFQLSIIARVLNEGRQGKWVIYCIENKFNFILLGSNTPNYAELHFASAKIAEHVITHFKDILDVLYL